MVVYHIQATEDEMESIHAIMDAFGGNLSKNSIYQQDIRNVKQFLNNNRIYFDTAGLMRLCFDLMERNELSLEGAKAIREIVRASNTRTDSDQPLDDHD